MPDDTPRQFTVVNPMDEVEQLYVHETRGGGLKLRWTLYRDVSGVCIVRGCSQDEYIRKGHHGR